MSTANAPARLGHRKTPVKGYVQGFFISVLDAGGGATLGAAHAADTQDLTSSYQTTKAAYTQRVVIPP